MFCKKDNKKGFTLIEILIVLGIIGILAVFLVPNIMGAQDKGKETAVKSVMHTVQLAVESYNMENLSYPVAKNISLYSLASNYLIAGGYLTSIPKNPYTGKEYTDSESAGKIVYDFDDVEGKYVITGYKRNGITKVLELDNL